MTDHGAASADDDSLPWRDALPSAEQIRRLDANEASKHYRQRQQTQRRTRGRSQGRSASVCVRDVRVRDGRAIWARRDGNDQRAGADAALSLVHPVFLVHSGVAGGGGINDGDCGGGRILPLAARSVRRLLGISGGVVELERFGPSDSGVRRVVY